MDAAAFFLCCVLNKLLLLRGASESIKVEVITVGTEFCSRFGIELACFFGRVDVLLLGAVQERFRIAVCTTGLIKADRAAGKVPVAVLIIDFVSYNSFP